MKNKIETICLILVAISILISAGFYYYTQQNECKDKCDYRPTNNLVGNYWKYKTIEGNSKIFETQSQCIDYCLRHK